MKNNRGGVLGVTLDDVEMPLTDSIEKELRGRAEPRHKVRSIPRLVLM